MNFGIDLLRHLFSLAVILQHMTSASRYSHETNLQLASLVNWVDGAVVGFFFISGFLFKPSNDLSSYAKKQTVKLLVPFFLFSLIYSLILAGLGKSTLLYGLTETVMLHGASMQLYFLPFLLFISVTYAFCFEYIPSKLKRDVAVVLVVILISICLIFPTDSSTGSNYKLLPFYYVSFILGSLCRVTSKGQYKQVNTLGAVLISLFIGLYDSRFYDLSGVILLFVIGQVISQYLPERRLFGSGGVYLLHTPIINFAISILLLKIGVSDELNILFSMAITYLLCLTITFAIVRLQPKYKWLLLE